MNKDWNFEYTASLDGKVIVVTGGNSGLGYESVKLLASKNASLILASRSLEKGLKAKEEIISEYPKAKIEVMALDLGNLESIEEFAKNFKSKYKQLDILFNNAGVMNTPYSKTEQGFEHQIGVNHLGHFVLTGHLFDLLKRTKNSRIVNISSLLHKKGVINFDTFIYKDGYTYSSEEAYAQSKLANLLFTYALDRKIKDAGLDIKVLAAHPGGASTNLGRYQNPSLLQKILKKTIYSALMQNSKQGAMSGLRAALDKEIDSGTYIGPSGFLEASGVPYIAIPSQLALNQELQDELWKVSERLTNFKFEVQ